LFVLLDPFGTLLATATSPLQEASQTDAGTKEFGFHALHLANFIFQVVSIGNVARENKDKQDKENSQAFICHAFCQI
jgi:hypothetical protein